MLLGEADTRAKLIDPALHARGWTEDLIRREETAGAVEIVGDRPRRRARGRVDYTLRVKVNAQSQPVAVALLEAKAEHLPPAHGLEQAKAYAACRRLNVLLAFASNGHQFVGVFAWVAMSQQKAGGASGSMKKITRSQLEHEAIPLPEADEQERIARELSHLLSTAKGIIQEIERQVQVVAAMKTALLRRALSGTF